MDHGPETQADQRQRLIALWSEIFAMPVDCGTDFFALGGDSIMAMRMLGKARGLLGVRVGFGAFRAAPTIDGLIDATRETYSTDLGKSVPESLASTGLCKQQQAALYAHYVAPGSRAYLAESATTIVGPLDVEALTGCLRTIFERHDIYRTVFEEQDGRPLQKILPTAVLDFRTAEIDLAPGADEREAIVELAATELPVIDRLDTLPLCNFLLVRISETRHVLFHREHHIIHDGWSSSEFTREIIELYREKTEAGYRARLGETGSFATFARQQSDWLETDRAHEELEYWRGELAGAPPGIALFGRDHASLSYIGDHVRTLFSRQEWDGFERRARELGVTPFTLFASAMYVCLWRYSGQNDLPLGSAFAARDWDGSERTLGMYVNTVVLRQSIDPHLSFGEFVTRVDRTVNGAIEHQSYPYLSLVEKLERERQSEANPFTNVMLGFHDTPIDTADPEGIQFFKDETVHSDSTKFDLTALVVHRADHSNPAKDVNVLWEYRSELYSRWEIEALVAGLANLVRELAGPDRQIACQFLEDIAVVDRDRKALMRQAAMGSVRPEFPRLDIVATIAMHANEQGAQVAIRDELRTLTFRELICEARSVATRIAALGLPDDASVAITHPRGGANVAAMLGAMRAGVPFVQIDENLPPKRIEFIVRDASVALVIGSEPHPKHEVLAVLPRYSALDDPAAREGAPSPDLPSNPVASDAIVYICYTSGSTGIPKGVCVPRHALANVSGWTREALAMDPDTIATSLVAPGFDAYMFEVWPPLLAGGKLVMLSDAVRSDPHRLANAFSEAKATNIFFPTALFDAYCKGDYRWPDSLMTVSMGGDAMSALDYSYGLPDVVFNMYGPTETTVLSTAGRFTRGSGAVPHIGTPIANTFVRILDLDGRDCPMAVPGELVIGGEGVAAGYRNLEAETEKSFVCDPETGARTYRTGDIVRWGARGELLFEGRKDDQIKVRGYRVAPAEITTLLDRDERVASSLVVAAKDSLIAYVMRSDGHDAERPADGVLGRRLRSVLKQRLPEYMLPQAIIALERFPLTDRGKIDREALPTIQAPAQQNQRAPAGETETALASLWEKVIERDIHSANRNFFAYGGQSIEAMRLIALVRERFGVRLAMHDFYRSGTIEQQARFIERALAERGRLSDMVEEGTI